ncbi:MAG: hypothetical protein JRF30_01810 [Deltaproteobacteria bacterium]|nr:hypothetical protein [Deltaproteobacteria bacterium]
MRKLRKDLQTVTRALETLTKKTERLTKAVDKLEKAQTSGKQKAKAKTTKKAPAKEPTARTANDQVVNIIKGIKEKGADVPTLIKKTGFEDKKIRNMVFRTTKHGKIKRAGRGVYIGA